MNFFKKRYRVISLPSCSCDKFAYFVTKWKLQEYSFMNWQYIDTTFNEKAAKTWIDNIQKYNCYYKVEIET